MKESNYMSGKNILWGKQPEVVFWMGSCRFAWFLGGGRCSAGESILHKIPQFNIFGIKAQILWLLLAYKTRGLLTGELILLSEMWKGLGVCRSVNSLSNPPIPFHVRRGIFTLLFSHQARGLHLLFECEIMNFSFYWGRLKRGKRLGVGQSILYY